MALGTPSEAVGLVLADLVDEHAGLADLVSDIDASAWRIPTPALGWDVADSVSHLRFFDMKAALAIRDVDGFARDADEMATAFSRGDDPSVVFGRSASAGELLDEWRVHAAALILAARNADVSRRVPWYGPSMSLASFLTARLMETWAHGVDVADALGKPLVVSHRLRHVCHIGFLARANSYRSRKLDVPDADIALRLRAPDGTTWSWGNASASESIIGTALDFSLVVTQRRHLDDTSLAAEGPLAHEWLRIAQAFAGKAGQGRRPLGK